MEELRVRRAAGVVVVMLWIKAGRLGGQRRGELGGAVDALLCFVWGGEGL